MVAVVMLFLLVSGSRFERHGGRVAKQGQAGTASRKANNRPWWNADQVAKDSRPVKAEAEEVPARAAKRSGPRRSVTALCGRAHYGW